MKQTMKQYSKPVIKSIDIKSADCFMATAGSGDHGYFAPDRKLRPF